MKKGFYLFVLAVLLFSLSACTGSSTPSPITQEIRVWQNAYSKFLKGVETYNYIDREFIIPGSYNIPPVFYLYDIDKNGIPELILITDDGNWENSSCDIFTYTSNAVIKIGNIKWNWFGSIGASDNADGLFSDDSYKGHYGHLYRYTINNDTLVEQLICEYQFRPHPDEKGYIAIYDDNGDMQSFIEDDENEYAANSPEAHELIHELQFDFFQITEENIEEVIMKFGDPN